MKQFYFLFLLGLFTTNSIAQIELSFEGEFIPNGDTVEFSYYDSIIPIIIYTEFAVKNTNSNSQDVVVRAGKSEMFPGTEVRMCWGPHCYGPLLDETPNPITIAPNGTNNSFQAKFLPNDHLEADGYVRFTFLDTLNASDSAWVICHYKHIAEEVENNDATISRIQLPSFEYFLVDGAIKVSDAEVLVGAVYSMKGQSISHEKRLTYNTVYLVTFIYRDVTFVKQVCFFE